MKPLITCENPNKGTLSFYLSPEEGKYYLFSQNYRKGMADYFKNGLRLDMAYDFSKCHNDSAVIRVLSKLPSYIKYIEKEYTISVLRQTKKKMQKNKKTFNRSNYLATHDWDEYLVS